MMRRILRWIIYATGLLLILIVGLLAFMQTGPGQRLIATELSKRLSTPEAGIEITGLKGWVPLNMRLKQIRLSDRDGVWLTAEDIAFDWSPRALIGGRIRIDDIGASRIEITRPPLAADMPEEPPTDEPFRLPELPASLTPITVARLAVPAIDLGKPVLGEAASFALEGSIDASDDGERVTAALELRRTDQTTAAATLDAIIALATPSLDLKLDVEETGGLVARLAGKPSDEAGDVAIHLEGSGPLNAWSGTLHADADGLARLALDLGLALNEQPGVTIKGTATPAPDLLPGDITPLIGETLAIDLDLVQTKAQALDLRKVNVSTELATLDAKGSVDFGEGGLALQAGLDLPDLAPLSELAKGAVAGKGDLQLTVEGTLSAPDGRLDLQTEGLSFGGNGAETLATGIRWITKAPLDSEAPAFDTAIDGGTTGLAISGTPLPDSRVDWKASLAVPLEGEITIERAEIGTAGATLGVTGSLDPIALEGLIDLTLDASSLRRLAEPYGQAVDGRASITAAIGLADGAQNVTVDLDATLSQLAGLPPGASQLIGKRAELRAKAALQDSTFANLENLTLKSAGIDLGGKGSIDLDGRGLKGELSAALPDLAVLAALVPAGIEGAIDLKVDVGGSLDAPSTDLALEGQDLVVAGEAITRLALALNGSDLAASPTGDLALDLTVRDTPSTLGLNYRLGDGVLHLKDINLTAPETALAGALDITLDTSLIEGTLGGGSAELAALESLIQQPLGGSVDISATLAPENGQQGATLAIEGRAIEGDFGRVASIDLDAVIADALGKPALKGGATITGFARGDVVVDALTLKADGSQEQLDFRLNVAGEAVKPFDIATDGTVTLADGLSLALDRLDGAFADEPIKLAKPLAFRQEGNALSLSDLDLRVGEARLTGTVDIGKDRASGAIDLRSLPLSWSEIFGGPALTGNASADIDLSGSAGTPKVVAAVRIDDLVGEDMVAEETPMDVVLDASLDQGRLVVDLTASGITAKPITANASLPARFGLVPFAFETSEDGPLDGRIDMELQLARLADLLALDGQDMGGRLNIDLAIGGTLAEPEIDGPIVLTDVSYENDASGTDIQALNMKAFASTERIEISEFRGRTGREGTIEADGWLQLDGDFPLSISLRLDEARLIDRSDAEARISGEIAMIGDLTDASIEGDLTVDRAELQIPDGGGPSLPELDVEEIGGNIVNPPEEELAVVEDREPAFDPALGIRVGLANKIYVRGRGLESEWQGDLRISGRASDPLIVGDLSIKKGYFDFLDKRFELERGEISFSGRSPPNPIIALQAVAEDDDFKAIIRLNGPASDPKLLLESEPVLPQDEVLARLLFNRELSEIGPVEAGKLALAANRLRGGGGFDVFGEIRGILQIDTLDVVSGEEGDSRVRAGKYLNDDVYVEVEKGAADESGRARVEIELLPNIALEAEAGEDANSGVGVKWKLDY